MKQETKVLIYLSNILPEAICDDCLAEALKFSSRQNANRITRPLEANLKIKKHKRQCPQCGVYKLCSSYIESSKLPERDLQLQYKTLPATSESLEKLIEIGFSRIGQWDIIDESLIVTLEKLKFSKPALYAFTLNGTVMYVGKTKRHLYKRIDDYRRGHKGQRTSYRLHLILMELMQKNQTVEIYGFCSEMPFKLGAFDVNLAAGLEDNIINDLKPNWNMHS